MAVTTVPLRLVPMRRRLLELALGLVFLGYAGCTSPTPTVPTPEQAPTASRAPAHGEAEKLFIVDCLPPLRYRKLGRNVIYPERRPPRKVAALDCEAIGGEYDIPPLQVWLPRAQEGDAEAQAYVGEIFEKGIGGVPPDYEAAATWYRRAAEQGYSRAQINLGHLYEQGLGVAKDPVQALNWYRKASGLDESVVLDTGSIRYSGLDADAQTELQSLRQEVERWKQESATLRQQLEQTQQQLDRARQQLQQRQSSVERERQELEQARQGLEKRRQQAIDNRQVAAEFQQLEGQLDQREKELGRRQQELVQLRQEVSRMEEENARRNAQLEKLRQQRQVALAGPTIDILDPFLVGTRSLSVVQVPPQTRERVITGRVTSPAGLQTLTVNGRQERPDDQGLFRASIPMQGKSVPVQVVAIDQQDKRASVKFQLMADGGTSAPEREGQVTRPAPRAIDFGTYYALIIGNNAYQHWPDLMTPESDATEVATILREHYGFKTTMLLNATRYAILQGLNELRKQLTEKDNLLIYYAGHGQWEEQIKRGYWIPIDGDLDSNVNWIPTFAVTDILGAMSAKHVLVVADSCYSGALTRSAFARLEAGLTEEARQHALETMAEKRSRTVLSSGNIQPVLDAGGGQHSVFAKAFLDALRMNAEIIEGQRLWFSIRDLVAYAAEAEQVEQDPQYAPLKFAGHEAGDFIFVPMAARLSALQSPYLTSR